jgi:hypothetical protein
VLRNRIYLLMPEHFGTPVNAERRQYDAEHEIEGGVFFERVDDAGDIEKSGSQ